MSESWLMVGMFGLLCGIFGLCLVAMVMLITAGMRSGSGKKAEKGVGPEEGMQWESKMDSAMLKQWDNLLGYNGNEGEDLDE